ncbi:hypothetical protein EV182_008667, partial [Spiromyces aspiralis]
FADHGYAVEYFFQAPNTLDADDENAADGHSKAADTGDMPNADNIRQASAEIDENHQLSLPLIRRSLALSCAVGIRSGRSATPSLSVGERIFSLAQQHTETCFIYGIWKADSNACTSLLCTKDEKDLPETYYDLMRSAVLLFKQGSMVEGWHVLSKAFDLVKPILKSVNVRALNSFWTSLILLVQSDHAAI